jgi:hypothetical protein
MTEKIGDVFRKLKELELTYKQKMTKMFMLSHFWWNMNHKSSKSADPIIAPL